MGSKQGLQCFACMLVKIRARFWVGRVKARHRLPYDQQKYTGFLRKGVRIPKVTPPKALKKVLSLAAKTVAPTSAIRGYSIT